MAHQGKRHACAQIERELESRIRLGHCVQGAEIQELGRTRLRRSPVRHSAGNGLSTEQLTPAVVACATDAFALAERFDAQCACRMLGKHAPPCGFVAACELDWLRFRHEGLPVGGAVRKSLSASRETSGRTPWGYRLRTNEQRTLCPLPLTALSHPVAQGRNISGTSVEQENRE